MKNNDTRGLKENPTDTSTAASSQARDSSADDVVDKKTRGCTGDGPSSDEPTDASTEKTASRYGTTAACPECDESNIQHHSQRNSDAEKRYLCRTCGAKFDEPVERERRSSGKPNSPHAQSLLEADPEDLVTDGGQAVLEVTGSLDPATATDMQPPADGFFVVDEERDEWLVAQPRNGGDV